MPSIGAHTAGKVAHPNLMIAEPRGSTTTVAAFCNDRVTRTWTMVAVRGWIEIGTVVHTVEGALQKFRSRSVRRSIQISQMRVFNWNGTDSPSSISAEYGRKTSIPIKIWNERRETTSNGCAISTPAIWRGTSMYPFTSTITLPTPTMSGAGFLKDWIGGRVGTVSTAIRSPSRTPIRYPRVRRAHALLRLRLRWKVGRSDSGRLDSVRGFRSRIRKGLGDFREGQFRAKWSMPPQL